MLEEFEFSIFVTSAFGCPRLRSPGDCTLHNNTTRTFTVSVTLTMTFAARSLSTIPRRIVASRQGFSTLLNLEDEFPGLPSVSPQAAKATTGSVSTLPNGLTIVSEDASSTSTVTMTYPNAGSASEMMNEQGAAFLNKCLAFKSGSDKSSLLINRMIENEGGMPFVTANRSSATLGYTVAPEKAVGLVDLLATDCSFEKWDIRDARALADTESEVASTSAQIVLTENLFAASYGPQSSAGRPFYSTLASLDTITQFRDRAYGLNGAVLAATGIQDHSAFCTEVAELLSGAHEGSAVEKPAMAYLGGESRVAAPSSGYAHVALAFQGPTSSVIGDVIKQLFCLAGIESGVSGFTATGMVGVYAGSTNPSGLIDAMTRVVTLTVSPDVIKRAKKLAKAEALFALDGGSKALAEFMTASVIESGSFSNALDVALAYDSVTEAQVKDALIAVLKSNPTLAAVGDITTVPYHATVAARFT